MVGMLAIADASYLWWAIRPALRLPTLELRICDACTRLEDTLAIAALYRCLIRLLIRRPELAPPWSAHTRRLIDENRWRAKRFGIDAEFISHDGRAALPCKDLVQSMVDEMAEDARHLRCEAELRRVRALLDEGTSAHEQLSLYLQARARGDSRVKALHAVVDWLIDATVPSA